jgi:hypothetical protein
VREDWEAGVVTVTSPASQTSTCNNPTVPSVLFHFSEDPAIEAFVPHVPRSNPTQPASVWAIDEDHETFSIVRMSNAAPRTPR